MTFIFGCLKTKQCCSKIVTVKKRRFGDVIISPVLLVYVNSTKIITYLNRNIFYTPVLISKDICFVLYLIKLSHFVHDRDHD
jgi:hypothetical protein